MKKKEQFNNSKTPSLNSRGIVIGIVITYLCIATFIIVLKDPIWVKKILLIFSFVLISVLFILVKLFLELSKFLRDTSTSLNSPRWSISILITFTVLLLFISPYNRNYLATIIGAIGISILLIGCILSIIVSYKLLLTSKGIKFPPTRPLYVIMDILPEKQRDILSQEIIDFEMEIFQALEKKNMLRATSIIISYYLGTSFSIIIWILDKVKKIIGIYPPESGS